MLHVVEVRLEPDNVNILECVRKHAGLSGRPKENYAIRIAGVLQLISSQHACIIHCM